MATCTPDLQYIFHAPGYARVHSPLSPASSSGPWAQLRPARPGGSDPLHIVMYILYTLSTSRARRHAEPRDAGTPRCECAPARREGSCTPARRRAEGRAPSSAYVGTPRCHIELRVLRHTVTPNADHRSVYASTPSSEGGPGSNPGFSWVARSP